MLPCRNLLQFMFINFIISIVVYNYKYLYLKKYINIIIVKSIILIYESINFETTSIVQESLELFQF